MLAPISSLKKTGDAYGIKGAQERLRKKTEKGGTNE